MSELGKPFPKKSDQKIKEQKIKVKMPHMNKKPLARKHNLVQRKKLVLEWTMKRFEKPLRKKSHQKKPKKNSKN